MIRFTRHLAFSPPRLWQILGDDGEVSLQWSSKPQGLWRSASAQWVIDRSQCIFRCLDLTHVPRAQRAQALAVKLAGLSPYRVPGHYAVWRGGKVMLWLWDQEVQQALSAAEADLPRHYRCLPESVLQADIGLGAESSRTRLLAVRRGVDLQVWEDGVLMQSIHYPRAPSTSELGILARGGHGLESLPSMTHEREDYLFTPWGGAWQSMQGEWERWVPHGLIAVLLLGCSVQLTQGLMWWTESGKLQAAHTQLVEQIEPLLNARARAQQARAVANEFQQRMQAQPSQIELLRTVGSLLPPDTKLVSWRLRSNELEMQVITDNQDPRYFVQRFQDSGQFQNVRVEPASTGSSLRLLMSLGGEGKK